MSGGCLNNLGVRADDLQVLTTCSHSLLDNAVWRHGGWLPLLQKRRSPLVYLHALQAALAPTIARLPRRLDRAHHGERKAADALESLVFPAYQPAGRHTCDDARHRPAAEVVRAGREVPTSDQVRKGRPAARCHVGPWWRRYKNAVLHDGSRHALGLLLGLRQGCCRPATAAASAAAAEDRSTHTHWSCKRPLQLQHHAANKGTVSIDWAWIAFLYSLTNM